MQPERVDYGPDRSQYCELYRPPTSIHDGTVVLIHGGFWRSRYDLALGRPLAADLVAHGYTVCNLEYRRVGNGGGWPTTLFDVAAGIDRLAELDVDTDHVVTVGHSAGGHLAVWAAGRGLLPPAAPGAAPRVRVGAAVSQAGVLDLATACRNGIGDGAASDLLGGTPDEMPDRYAAADPIAHVPLAAPVLCIHSRTDDRVPFDQSVAYVAAATAAGATAALVETRGDHFTLIDPDSSDWAAVRDALPGLLSP